MCVFRGPGGGFLVRFAYFERQFKLFFETGAERGAETKRVAGAGNPPPPPQEFRRHRFRQLPDDAVGKGGGEVRQREVVERDSADAAAPLRRGAFP